MAWTYPNAEDAEWSGTLSSKNLVLSGNAGVGTLNETNETGGKLLVYSGAGLDTSNAIILWNNSTSGAVNIKFVNSSSPLAQTGEVGVWRDNLGGSGSSFLYIRLNPSSSDTSEIMRVSGERYVAIGGTPSTASSSAILSLSSTTQAFFPPVMTDTQMRAINVPQAGYMVYNSSSGAMYIYTSGANWRSLSQI